MMAIPGYQGLGSALRTAYRPLGALVDNAFEFLAREDEPLPDSTRSAAEAIARMRAAAAHLSAVSETVIAEANATPTARQVITDATDEAANFHA